MTKRHIILFFAILLFSCKKQEPVKHSNIYIRINGENSWGFNDSKGNVVIPLGKYTFLNPIDEEGMIYAQKGNKYGYIDIHQNEIIPFKYDKLDLFSEGLAGAKIKGKYGFLDRKGKEIIAFQFDAVHGFNHLGLALVKKNNKVGIINKKGETIIPLDYQNIIQSSTDKLIAVSKNNKWAFFSNIGKQLTDFLYDEITFSKSTLILVKQGTKIGYLDYDLIERIPIGKYSFGTSFNENGLAIVSSKKHYGIINEKNVQIIKTEFDSIGYLQEQYGESDSYVGFKNKRLTLFNQKGVFIIDNIKDYFKDFCSLNNKIKTIYQVQGINGLVGIVDDKGNIMIPLNYEEIERFNGQNKTVVKYKGKYGLIDSNNTIVLPLENEYIESYKDEKYYIIKKKDKTGIVDYNFKTIFNFVYQDISPCTYNKENRFIVRQNDKYGVIDRFGKVIIPFEYSEMSNWVEYGPGSDYHFVTKNNKRGIISKEGKIIIPPIYDSLFYKSDKTIILSRKNKYGIVTIQNKPVIPFIYDMIYLDFSDANKNVNRFYVQKNEKYFIIDNKNKVIKASVSKEEVKNKFFYYNL